MCLKFVCAVRILHRAVVDLAIETLAIFQFDAFQGFL